MSAPRWRLTAVSLFAVIGFARKELTTEQFRQQLTEDLKKFATSSVEPEIWNWFLQVWPNWGRARTPLQCSRQVSE